MPTNHKPASGSDTPPITLIFLVAVGLGWLILCWPALIAHGYTDTGGWRWDIHSTYACAAWWGFLALASLIFWADRRERKLPKAPRDLPGSIRAAWDAVEEDERGGPRRDLRDVTNKEEMTR